MNGDVLNEKKRALGRRRMPETVKNFDYISLEELMDDKVNVYGIKDQPAPDFFSMSNKSDVYYFMRDKLEMVLENTNGAFPTNFLNSMYIELRKNYYFMMMDICGAKIVANRMAGVHKFQFDKVLKAHGAYDYYSPNLGKHLEDIKI